MFPIPQRPEEIIACYLAVNQFLGSFALFQIFSTFTPDFSIKNKEIEKFSNLPNGFDAIDYVNLANSLVWQGDCKRDCKDYTYATFDCYHKLIRLNKGEDLKKEIRILVGDMISYAHTWLEVRHSKSIMPYECTIKTPPLSVHDVKSYSEESLTNKMEYLIENGIVSTVLFKGLWGRDFGFPTFYSLVYRGGFISMLYKSTRVKN